MTVTQFNKKPYLLSNWYAAGSISDALNQLPETIRSIFSSEMVTGGITATLLHLLIPGGNPRKVAKGKEEMSM